MPHCPHNVVSIHNAGNVSQGSVVTYSRCGEIFDDYFIANSPSSVLAEKF